MGDIRKTANKERCWRKKPVYTQTAIAKEWIQYKGTGYISFLTRQSAESPWSHCIDKCIDNVFGSKSGLRMLIKVRMCRTFVLRPLVFWDLHTQIYQNLFKCSIRVVRWFDDNWSIKMGPKEFHTLKNEQKNDWCPRFLSECVVQTLSAIVNQRDLCW